MKIEVPAEEDSRSQYIHENDNAAEMLSKLV